MASLRRLIPGTNLFIAADRDPDWEGASSRFSAAFLPFIRLHAVVAQELPTGAADGQRERLVEENLTGPFEGLGRVVCPSFGAWKTASRILERLVHRQHLSPGGFKRSILNDSLLGASCRGSGLALITLNPKDFDLIRRVHPFDFTEPFPA